MVIVDFNNPTNMVVQQINH